MKVNTPPLKVSLFSALNMAKPPKVRPQVCLAEYFYFAQTSIRAFLNKEITIICWFAEVLILLNMGLQIGNAQIAEKDWVRKLLLRKLPYLWKGLQNFLFVICGTYLGTFHLCSLKKRNDWDSKKFQNVTTDYCIYSSSFLQACTGEEEGGRGGEGRGGGGGGGDHHSLHPGGHQGVQGTCTVKKRFASCRPQPGCHYQTLPGRE